MNTIAIHRQTDIHIHILIYIPFCGKFIGFSMRGENQNPNISIAEDGELLCLLEETGSALAEGDLSVHRVLDPLHLNLSSGHIEIGFRILNQRKN